MKEMILDYLKRSFTVARLLLLYPTFLLINAACTLTQNGYEAMDMPTLVTAAVFSFFVLFSVARVFAENDDRSLSQFINIILKEHINKTMPKSNS